MSWFSDIAGKAESFLNRMDQTAAVALNSSQHEESTPPKPNQHSITSNAANQPHMVTHQPKYAPQPIAPVAAGHSRNSSLGSSFSTISNREAIRDAALRTERQEHILKDDDEKLFDFLNSKGDHAGRDTRSKRSLSPKKEEEALSVASNEPSIDVLSVSDEEERRKSARSSGKTSPDSDHDQEQSPLDQADAPLLELPTSSSIVDIDDQPGTATNSVIELTVEQQNQRLREEMGSLTAEIARLNKRNIEAETEVKRLSRRIENWQNQLSSSDQALRELQSRELDLKAGMEAKDQSLALLKVRLEEADQKLRVRDESLSALRIEYDALVKEREQYVATTDDSLQSTQRRVQQIEAELLAEQDAHRAAQHEALQQQSRFEELQAKLSDELGTLGRDLKTERQIRRETEKQLKQLRERADQLEADHEAYKLKAQKTLQSKEELIRALQRSRADGDEGIADTSDAQIDFEQSNSTNLILQAQCDALSSEVQELTARNESLRTELSRLRNEELDQLQAQLTLSAEQLEEERRLKLELEAELRQTQDELRYFKDDLSVTKDNLNQRINDRDAEIEKLRKQLVSKRSTASGQSLQELEARVKSLTDNLIQKQTLVEQLSSERHSLALQLERSDSRLRQALEAAQNSSGPDSVAIGMVHSSSSSNLVNRAGYRQYADYENPQDHFVARRVKRAYGQLDAFSIRMGMFLRAYPSARGLLLIYIVVLHVFIFFVLFSYRPEIHDLDH